MTDMLLKVLTEDRKAMVSGTGFQYPPKAWTKHLDPKTLSPCRRGYHCCEGPQILGWLREGALFEMEPCPKHKPLRGEDKQVSCRLRIVRKVGGLTPRVLRLFACDCAERALRRERRQGREPDKRSWGAVRIARLFADGKATKQELAAAYAAANAAAYAAANAAYAAANGRTTALAEMAEMLRCPEAWCITEEAK